MLKTAEKLDFQTRTMVDVRQKTVLGRQTVMKNLVFLIFF